MRSVGMVLTVGSTSRAQHAAVVRASRLDSALTAELDVPGDHVDTGVLDAFDAEASVRDEGVFERLAARHQPLLLALLLGLGIPGTEGEVVGEIEVRVGRVDRGEGALNLGVDEGEDG